MFLLRQNIAARTVNKITTCFRFWNRCIHHTEVRLDEPLWARSMWVRKLLHEFRNHEEPSMRQCRTEYWVDRTHPDYHQEELFLGAMRAPSCSRILLLQRFLLQKIKLLPYYFNVLTSLLHNHKQMLQIHDKCRTQSESFVQEYHLTQNTLQSYIIVKLWVLRWTIHL